MTDTKPTILIVEDDDALFRKMIETLEHLIKENPSRNFDIVRAISLREAVVVWENTKLAAISIDMQFPIFAKDKIYPENGAELLAHLYHGEDDARPYNKNKILFYTGLQKAEAEEVLIRYGFNVNTLPQILHKSRMHTHTKWAEALLTLAHSE